MNRKRAANYNSIQNEMLVEFLKKNPTLAEGKFSTTFTYKDSQKLWGEISALLNSVPTGAVKEWKQWRKVWQDIRTKVKSKKSILNRSATITGGGPPNDNVLDDTDNEVLEIIGPAVVDGIPGAIEFEVMPVEHSTPVKFEADSELATELSTLATEVSEEEGPLQSVVRENVINKGRKRPRRVERLQNTVVAANNLHEVAVNKLKMKESYYQQKLALYERDVRAKEEMAESLKKIAAVLENK